MRKESSTNIKKKKNSALNRCEKFHFRFGYLLIRRRKNGAMKRVKLLRRTLDSVYLKLEDYDCGSNGTTMDHMGLLFGTGVPKNGCIDLKKNTG